MTLHRWIDGKTSPTVTDLQAFAKATGRDLAWFLGLEPPKPVEPLGTAIVPVLDVRAAAGAGSVADVVQAEAQFAFPTYFLEKLLKKPAGQARLSSLRARGDSMEPTISNNALVIIDENDRDLPDVLRKGRRAHPDIFVFFTTDGLRLKRLRRIDKEFIAIISDNPTQPEEIFRLNRDGTLKIVGKVIWWDNRL
jgi:phage repressor protein C with HTH and peptisase S24 domain